MKDINKMTIKKFLKKNKGADKERIERLLERNNMGYHKKNRFRGRVLEDGLIYIPGTKDIFGIDPKLEKVETLLVEIKNLHKKLLPMEQKFIEKSLTKVLKNSFGLKKCSF